MDVIPGYWDWEWLMTRVVACCCCRESADMYSFPLKFALLAAGHFTGEVSQPLKEGLSLSLSLSLTHSLTHSHTLSLSLSLSLCSSRTGQLHELAC